MIDIKAVFVCDKCGKEHKKTFMINEQGMQSLDSKIPVNWDFVKIKDVRFLLCDACVISLVLGMLNQG